MASRTRLLGTAINIEVMLEVAKLAIGLNVIAKRRSAGFDRCSKHVLNGR